MYILSPIYERAASCLTRSLKSHPTATTALNALQRTKRQESYMKFLQLHLTCTSIALYIEISSHILLEEALDHPWLPRHPHTNVVMSAGISEGVMVKGLRLSRRGSIFCGRIAKRNMRMSMFGT